MDIYCMNCENACSEQAVACPKCGHPLKGPSLRKTRTKILLALAAITLVCTVGFVGRDFDVAVWLSGEDAVVDVLDEMKSATEGLEFPPHRDEKRNQYGADLAAGRPVIYGGRRYRAVTAAFADRLSDAVREEWLSQCFERLTSEIQGHVNIDILARAGYGDPLEAIYNLTHDAALKGRAFAQWSDLEHRHYNSKMADHQAGRRRPDGNRVNPPHMLSIGEWKKK